MSAETCYAGIDRNFRVSHLKVITAKADSMTDIPTESYEIPQQPEFRTAIEEASAEWLQPSEQINNSTGLHLINTRLWLNQLSEKYGQPISIASIPDQEWQELFGKYEAFWFMGIYKPSEASRQHAKKYPKSVEYAKKQLNPEEDIVASPFAIPDYSPNPAIARDWDEWDLMVEKLHEHGKKVFIDFVPNHVAVDHPWAKSHPEYFIQGKDEQKARNPGLYVTVTADDGKTYHLAHGKDPNYPEWSDTLQLNYARPEVHQAMQEILLGNEEQTGLVHHADGVRCDMAMLLNPGTLIRTWGNNYDDEGNWTGMDHMREEEKRYIFENKFWPETIAKVKEKANELGKEDFTFVAEAYWDFDELGEVFDVLYGKDFYDDLRRIYNEDPKISPDDLKRHIEWLLNGQKKALFTENHDEPRAVTVFGIEGSKAAAVITALIPKNIFLMNQRQEEGRKIRVPMQLDRPPEDDIDPPDPRMKRFYDRLLTLKHTRLFQEGEYRMAELAVNNPYIMAIQVESPKENEEVTRSDEPREMGAVVCTNFSKNIASCRIPEIDTAQDVRVVSLSSGKAVTNIDMRREGGLYVELIPWESQIILYAPNPESQHMNDSDQQNVFPAA